MSDSSSDASDDADEGTGARPSRVERLARRASAEASRDGETNGDNTGSNGDGSGSNGDGSGSNGQSREPRENPGNAPNGSGEADGESGKRERRERSEKAPKKTSRSSEEIVADFVAGYVAGGNGSMDPSKGRVLMSNHRLIVATPGSKTIVPHSSIYDIAVGQVPPEVEQFFDTTIMVRYVAGERRRTTLVGGERDTIERFMLLLFRAVIGNSRALVVHPARRGGQVLDPPDRYTGVRLESDAVVFPNNDALSTDGEPFSIALDDVVFFEESERNLRGDDRFVLKVQYVEGDTEVTTEVSLSSRRKMNLLGRFFRLRYHTLQKDVRDVDLDETDLEMLVGIYSTGGEVDLASLLGVEDEDVDVRLDALYAAGLVSDETTPCSLTPQGRLVVNERIEGING